MALIRPIPESASGINVGTGTTENTPYTVSTSAGKYFAVSTYAPLSSVSGGNIVEKVDISASGVQWSVTIVEATASSLTITGTSAGGGKMGVIPLN